MSRAKESIKRKTSSKRGRAESTAKYMRCLAMLNYIWCALCVIKERSYISMSIKRGGERRHKRRENILYKSDKSEAREYMFV